MVSLTLFLFGLIIGSFLAALTYRFPRGVIITKGRSFCPNCKHTIAWFDNIPLLSYLLLKGKCRNCGRKISVRYPVIEFATGIVFLLIGVNPLLLIISSVLIAILVIDWEHMIIPDDFVFFGLFTAFVFLLGRPDAFYLNLFTGFASALFFLAVYIFSSGKGMGLGDVKLAVLIGAVLGPGLSLVWLFSSFITGGIVAAILLASRKAKLKERIAFGPFLVIGFFIAALMGDKLLYLF